MGSLFAASCLCWPDIRCRTFAAIYLVVGCPHGSPRVIPVTPSTRGHPLALQHCVSDATPSRHRVETSLSHAAPLHRLCRSFKADSQGGVLCTRRSMAARAFRCGINSYGSALFPQSLAPIIGNVPDLIQYQGAQSVYHIWCLDLVCLSFMLPPNTCRRLSFACPRGRPLVRLHCISDLPRYPRAKSPGRLYS